MSSLPLVQAAISTKIRARFQQELRAQFLACREAHLTGLVADIEGAGTAYETLRRLTDMHRVHLFDAVMQYRAVFSNDAPQVRLSISPTTSSHL